MTRFDVPDMTCGHCAATITRALKAADPQAQVHVDLARRRVDVAPVDADTPALLAAIAGAGYTPRPVSTEPGPGAAA